MKPFSIIFVLLLFIKCNMLPTNYPVHRTPSPAAVSNNENKEFADLMAKDQINKSQRTAEVLTYLLNDTESSDSYTAAVIENASNCNIIVRMIAVNGKQIYNLPIPKNAKNHFKIAKGSYTLKSNICDAKYYSQKNISEPLILKLSSH